MTTRPPLEFGQVPIIGTTGAPMRAYGAVIMAQVACQCRPSNPPMLIRGTDLMVTCPLCHNRYGIVSASFNRELGDEAPAVVVGLLVPPT